MKIFKVGGAVRDEILGIKSKDVDFAVEADSFSSMRDGIIRMGGTIFIEKEEFLTIRAHIPLLGAVDFVLCRKESHYTDSRHPDSVTAGTILDDLARRDFTMNAIAIDMDNGEIIDPFDGQIAIKVKLIRTVGNAEDRFNEDPLRIVRAVRFAITKQFELSAQIRNFLEGDFTLKGVSSDRIFDEVNRMFAFNTLASLRLLEKYPHLRDEIFTKVKLRADLRP